MRRFCVLLMVFSMFGVSWAENWPHFRGPGWDGTTTETGMPAALSEKSIRWKYPLPGIGSATAVIWGDRLFLPAADGATKEIFAICLDAKTGQEVWKKTVAKVDSPRNVAACSAVTDGHIVVFLYGSGDCAVYEVNGKLLWQRNLGDNWGKFDNKFVYSSSPLLFGDRLYIYESQSTGRREKDKAQTLAAKIDPKELGESYLACLEPRTGKEIFKVERQVKAQSELWDAYASPVPFKNAGKDEILTVGAAALIGHNPSDGKELWKWSGYHNPAKSPWGRYVSTPTWYKDIIYISAPEHNPLFAVRVPAEPNDAPLWTYKVSPDVCSLLAYRDRLYMLHGQGKSFLCFEPESGKVIWDKKLETAGFFQCSPTAADGKIYFVSLAGEVMIIAAGDEFKLLSRLDLGEKEVQASVAIAGGRLYVHAPKMLYCLE